MDGKRLWRSLLVRLVVAALFVFGMKGPADATSIQYGVQQISGTTWEYSYWVSGYAFSNGEGFRIFFDYALYGAFPTAPVAPNTDWDALVLDPDVALPGDGVYDAMALPASPTLVDPFVVRFAWLGTGIPGSQPFEIYDTSFITMESGMTSPIPEPTTLLLLASGLTGIAAVRRSRRNKET